MAAKGEETCAEGEESRSNSAILIPLYPETKISVPGGRKPDGEDDPDMRKSDRARGSRNPGKKEAQRGLNPSLQRKGCVRREVMLRRGFVR